MIIKQKLETLGSETNKPCVTISLNTHRTHPDNAQDLILLKNLVNEAKDRVLAKYNEDSVAPLLEKLSNIDINMNYNLDSLHIFLSNETKEIIKSPWTTQNRVQVSETFGIRSLIKKLNRSEDYHILQLSQGEVKLYNATNDGITGEIIKEGFPFSENPYYIEDREKRSDGEASDNIIREYFNNVDKAFQKIHHRTGLHCVVISTDDNYSKLLQVADNPALYLGSANIDINKSGVKDIAEKAWSVVKDLLYARRTKAISEVKETMGQGNTLTDLQDIYQAAIDGRGDILILNVDYVQAVHMTSDRTFNLVSNASGKDIIDDITSEIAWEVLSKKGQVFFSTIDEINNIGKIILKTRF